METDIKIASVHSFLNEGKFDSPLFIQRNGVYFNNGSVVSKPTVSYEISGKLRMFNNGLIFGMTIGLQKFENTITGNVYYPDKSILGTYKLERGGTLLSSTYVLGYRFNSYKTIRPFFYVDLGLISDFADELYSSEISDPTYDYDIFLDLYTKIEMNKRFGLIAGFEYRKFKLSMEYHRMREQLAYENEGGSLSYSKRRTLSVGLTYRFAREFTREQDHITTNSTATKRFHFKQRKPKIFSVIAGGGANLSVGGEGFSLDENVSFLQVQKSFKTISGATTKEENIVTVLEMNNYDANFKGVPRGSFGVSIHSGAFEFETLGHYYTFESNQEYWIYQNKVSRYISNGNPGNYYVDGDNYKNGSEYSLRYQMEAIGYTSNLKIDFSDLSNDIAFPIYIGLGWQTTYVKLKNTLFKGGNINSEPIAQEILNLYTNQPISDEIGAFFNPDETNYYINGYDDEFIELVENKEENFIPFEEFKSTINSSRTKLSGLSLCVGMNFNKLDFRIGFDFGNTTNIGPVRKLNTAYISFNYHLWGW
ncbi:MAG: hypothetical protein ACI8Q1_000869 [Parvicella sp.]|jgi:hypothetical protein